MHKLKFYSSEKSGKMTFFGGHAFLKKTVKSTLWQMSKLVFNSRRRRNFRYRLNFNFKIASELEFFGTYSKNFGLSDRYRNRRKQFGLRFNLIVGLKTIFLSKKKALKTEGHTSCF